jgi:formylglycine-generating enzyme required for sulfatase activity
MRRFILFAAMGAIAIAFLSRAASQTPAELKESRTGMEFIRIPPGTFQMGCDAKDLQCDPDEKPLHEVRISREFQIGKYEVTQAQWAVMADNPSAFKSPDRPVESVSWIDATNFAAQMSAANDGFRYRLPTEAEWEYAARAGVSGPWLAEPLDGAAWFGAVTPTTMPVGQKRPNAWGLHDVAGNVWEWCQDWYDGKTYAEPAAVNPTGPLNGEYRILRGGAWGLGGYYLRLSFRDGNTPDFKDKYTGFRLVRESRN